MRKNFRIGEDYSGAGFWGLGNSWGAEEKQVLTLRRGGQLCSLTTLSFDDSSIFDFVEFRSG
jgi:hypothetical protein